MKKEDIDTLSALNGMEQDEVKYILRYTNKMGELARSSLIEARNLIKEMLDDKEKDKFPDPNTPAALMGLYFTTMLRDLHPDIRRQVINTLNRFDEMEEHTNKQEELFQRLKKNK